MWKTTVGMFELKLDIFLLQKHTVEIFFQCFHIRGLVAVEIGVVTKVEKKIRDRTISMEIMDGTQGERSGGEEVAEGGETGRAGIDEEAGGL